MRHNCLLEGVCPSKVNFDLEDGIVKNIEFNGGCNGNLKAVAKLCEGLTPDEIDDKLSTITCGFKKTSCGAQLARAVMETKNND